MRRKVIRPRKSLPGYLDLCGKLTGTIAQELPIYLSQPEISLVRLFFSTRVPYERACQLFGPGHWLKPLRYLDYYQARTWSHNLIELVPDWPLDCLPPGLPHGRERSMVGLAAVFTFCADGRLRLNFSCGMGADDWYANGCWRELNQPEGAT